ncbi:MAG: sigma-54 dependent transcriptional regulator [Gemmatimonadetes bacterium]|nr:sigma-54 dependent transcriptional regulator [Gemmatimonadota bacterium]
MLPTVYILDDDATTAKLLSAVLDTSKRVQSEVFTAADAFFERCAEAPPAVVITDLVMPDTSGIDVTRRLREMDPFLPIFVLTAHGEMQSAIDALKAGATEYLTKPASQDELMTLLGRALEERPLREEAASIQQERRKEFSLGAILGSHPKVEEVREFVRRVAAIPRPTVLLLGESGTGKNLVARAIHYSSTHSAGRFVEINCSALPAHLLEAEVFGYQKGAFTDARETKRGLIELADGGTLFLDEIADLPFELQSKFLNFLESRRFRRVGGTDEIAVSLRLITATNRDLDREVRDGTFRADLYYRVSVASHVLPPLRDIKEDVSQLADNFREVFSREFRKHVTSIAPEALALMQDWHWPGNIRELRNVIERALIFTDGDTLMATDLPELGGVGAADPAQPAGASFPIPTNLSLADSEREYIRHTLELFDGNVQRSAESLGISRKNLWEKRKKHGLP